MLVLVAVTLLFQIEYDLPTMLSTCNFTRVSQKHGDHKHLMKQKRLGFYISTFIEDVLVKNTINHTPLIGNRGKNLHLLPSLVLIGIFMRCGATLKHLQHPNLVPISPLLL